MRQRSEPDDAPMEELRPEPTHEDVARRAHELYVERGGEPGHELEDWLRAEAELRG